MLSNSPQPATTPEPTHPSEQETLRREARLFIYALICVFVAETAIMLLVERANSDQIEVWIEALTDAFLLVAVVAPIIYYLLLRPLLRHIDAQKRAERELRKLQSKLEFRVQERTARLADANRELREEMEGRMRALEQLSYSEKKYSTLVESSLTGIFIYRDGKFTFVNRQFARMLGYSRDELLRVDPPELIHPEDRGWVSEIGRKRLRGEEAHTDTDYEARMVTKAGATIWVNLRNTSLQYRGSPSILGNVQEITRRKEVENTLRKSQTELRRLSSLLLTAQEEERARLAREIHDSIGQSLSGIKFAIESVLSGCEQPRHVQGTLNSLVPRIQDSIEEVRRLSMALWPSILDDLGLLATISWHCREFQSSYPNLRVETHIDVEEEEIPGPVRLPIYRILQEAMNNAAKHSGADQVLVCLRLTEDALELTVEDNGQGFDVQSVSLQEGCRLGFGLGSMRERAYLSGGSVSVDSSKGGGTAVHALWPIRTRRSRRLSTDQALLDGVGG